MQGTCKLDITLEGRIAVRERIGPSVAKVKKLLEEVRDECRSRGGVAQWGRLRFRLGNSGNLGLGAGGSNRTVMGEGNWTMSVADG